ncbi:hypothetical protein AAG906_007479 [Vitis piasezkii]
MIIIVINGRRIPRKPRLQSYQIKTEANVAEKASALVATTDHGDDWLWYCGKTLLLGLTTKDSNKLQQALMAMDPRGEEKSEIWLWRRRLDMLPLTKDEVNLLFQNFHKMIETQDNAKVRVLRSDNGGEYQSSDLQKYLEGHDIIHRLLVPIHPRNGVAERKNRHLLEVVRASLIARKHQYLIGRSNHICRILDQSVPSSSINFQTPLQALTNVVVAQLSQIYLLVFLVMWHLCIYTNANAPN